MKLCFDIKSLHTQFLLRSLMSPNHITRLICLVLLVLVTPALIHSTVGAAKSHCIGAHLFDLDHGYEDNENAALNEGSLSSKLNHPHHDASDHFHEIPDLHHQAFTTVPLLITAIPFRALKSHLLYPPPHRLDRPPKA